MSGTDVTWDAAQNPSTGTESGDWDTAGDWSTDTRPSSGDNVFIEPGSAVPAVVTIADGEDATALTVSIGGPSVSGHADLVDQGGLLVGNALTIVANGSVNIAGSLSLGGSSSAIVLSGGVLGVNGTIDGDGGTLALDGGSLEVGSATFDNVAIQGALSVGGLLWIQDGFAIGPGPGSIDVYTPGGVEAELYFAGSYTLRDTHLTLGARYGYSSTLSGNALTLDSQTTVTAADGAVIGGGGFAPASTVTNDGTVTVAGTAQEQATRFVNTGAVIVDGGSLEVKGGTFDNAGSIIVEHGGVFYGALGGAFSGTGTVFMETGSTTEIAMGVPTGADYTFINPATLILDEPQGFGATIGGLAAGDVIGLRDQTLVSGSISGTSLDLDLAGGDEDILNVAPGETGVSFVTTPSGDLEVACFAAGTRILTNRGAMPVEALREGDAVVSAFGAIRQVRWIGHRRIECARHPRPHTVWPVRVRAGAFADGAPLCDLLLSPDHAVFVDDGLIPIRYLVNGATVVREPVAEITYFHVELMAHDVLIAEGLRCESYLDTGNRGAFANGGTAVLAPADFARRIWAEAACAPLVLAGPKLVLAKQRLLQRAGALGHVRTVETDLHLLANGIAVRPEIDGAVHRFTLSRPVATFRLVSRHAAGSETMAGSTDSRRLGVAVARLTVDGRDVRAGDRPHAAGWHPAEPDWQWTEGDALVRAPVARHVEVTLLPLLCYWQQRDRSSNDIALRHNYDLRP